MLYLEGEISNYFSPTLGMIYKSHLIRATLETLRLFGDFLRAMSRLFESDEGPPWFSDKKCLVFKIIGCEKSLTTVTETVDRGKPGTTIRFLAVPVP